MEAIAERSSRGKLGFDVQDPRFEVAAEIFQQEIEPRTEEARRLLRELKRERWEGEVRLGFHVGRSRCRVSLDSFALVLEANGGNAHAAARDLSINPRMAQRLRELLAKESEGDES